MLTINDVATGYGKLEVIHGVSFNVPNHSAIGIIGRNGVGKSTLIKAICGYLPLNKGHVILSDTDISEANPSRRARLGIAYVQQGHGILADLTVKENLELGYRLGQTRAKNLASDGSRAPLMSYEDVYDLFPRLHERRNQRAGTLSGGEQACLAISRGVLSEPKILILDEPSEGLQPNLVDRIGEVINDLVKNYNLSVLLVEQNIGLIQMSTHICYALDKGIVAGILDANQIQQDEIIQQYLIV